MKTYFWILSVTYLLLAALSGEAQQKQAYSKNLDAYVGTWEYRSGTEYFKVVLKKGKENTRLFLEDCILGGYLYQKGQIVIDYTNNIPLEYNDSNKQSIKIQATNAMYKLSNVNHNKLRLYFYDEKVGYRTMKGRIELLSPTQIRWILQHPLSELPAGPAAERELYTVPTNVVLTKVVQRPPLPPFNPDRPDDPYDLIR